MTNEHDSNHDGVNTPRETNRERCNENINLYNEVLLETAVRN